MSGAPKKHLIVLASTFPRWEHDTVPDFVLNFTKYVMPAMRSATAVVPHFAGAKTKETLSGVEVRRFRYAYPYTYENLTYGQVAKKTIFYKLRGICYVIAELWATFWVCLRRRPGVISAHWMIPQGFVALLVGRLLGMRVVVSIHGQDATFKLGGTMGTLVKAVKRFILRHADVVVVNSSLTQAKCKELYPGKDYPIIPMGVDIARLQTGTRRAHRGYELLFVGRLAEVKGVIYLCEAMKHLAAMHKDAHLTIVGDGPDRESLEGYVRDNKLEAAISFVGWVQPEDLPKQYHSADVFVGPSIQDKEGRTEALGLVFVEAAAAGLPVVTTGVGGIRDVVQDKETGLIVAQKDPNALVKALEYLYDHRDEGVAMGKRGSRIAAERFAWERVAERYVELLSA